MIAHDVRADQGGRPDILGSGRGPVRLGLRPGPADEHRVAVGATTSKVVDPQWIRDLHAANSSARTGYAQPPCERCWLRLITALVFVSPAVIAPSASAEPAIQPAGAVTAPDGPAQAWLLADLDSGRILASKDPVRAARARQHDQAAARDGGARQPTAGQLRPRQPIPHRGRVLVCRTEAGPGLHHPPTTRGPADGVGQRRREHAGRHARRPGCRGRGHEPQGGQPRRPNHKGFVAVGARRTRMGDRSRRRTTSR